MSRIKGIIDAVSDLAMDYQSRMARAKEQGFDTDTPYYHGTLAKREIDRFRPSQDGILGKGVYMSRSPEVAERYAGYHRRTEPGGSMYPTHVKGKLWSVEERGLPRDTYKGTNDDIVKALEGEGFHGVDSGHETVVFDPANIRSVNAAFDPAKKDSSNLLAGVTGAGLLGSSMFASEDADAGAITKAAKESMLKFFNEAAVDNAMKQAGSRKSREALTQMSIDDFLSLARDGYDPTKSAGILDVSKFDDLPFLNIRSENGIANITGHEGRHRARRLKELGETTMPVRIKSDIRWDQQNDAKLWDYEQDYPQILFNEDGTKKSPFPFVQGDSNLLDSSALNIEDIQRKTTPTAKQIDDDELLKGLFGGSAATAVGAGTVLAPQDAQASNQPASKGLIESFGDTALETMSGVNRAMADGVNFLTSDQINAILNLSGSDKRIPDLYDIPGIEGGTQGNYMEPGLLRQIVRQGSEFLSPI